MHYKIIAEVQYLGGRVLRSNSANESMKSSDAEENMLDSRVMTLSLLSAPEKLSHTIILSAGTSDGYIQYDLIIFS